MENKNEMREMTQEELDAVVGGLSSESQSSQGTGGLICTRCGSLIPVSIKQIVSSDFVCCQDCGLLLHISKSKSAQALEILKKMEDAARRP